MAINKNSTGYTVGFAVVLVAVCGTILASLASALKPMQKANVENEKRQFILSATGEFQMEALKEMSQQEVSKLFEDNVTQAVYNYSGEEVEGDKAFAIDVVKEYKATKNSPEARRYPIFFYKNGNVEKSVIPIAGNGLWGPIWGYVALEKDRNTIAGVVFDHKSETPGLGAKIAEEDFMSDFTKSTKKIMDGDKYVSINVVKGGIKNPEHEIDAIAGATITSNGVGAMLRSGFEPYMKAFGKLK